VTRWDIDPAGVLSVLQRTEAVAGKFDGELTSLNTGLEGAAAQSSSEIVASALQGFVKSASGDIRFVLTRTGACLHGAAGATNAYVQGDLEMAATAQASAAGAPDPRATMPGARRFGPQ
jgi:Family of unknown function (DUF6507)